MATRTSRAHQAEHALIIILSYLFLIVGHLNWCIVVMSTMVARIVRPLHLLGYPGADTCLVVLIEVNLILAQDIRSPSR